MSKKEAYLARAALTAAKAKALVAYKKAVTKALLAYEASIAPARKARDEADELAKEAEA